MPRHGRGRGRGAWRARHVAFNNAGIERHGYLTADIEESSWNEVIAVNLNGVFLSMKYEIPEMLKHGGGAIVNTASVGGVVGNPGLGAYCAAKHGVIGITKVAALEYIAQGVRINALCPGGTATPMLKNWFQEPGVEEHVKALHPDRPLGRSVGTSESRAVPMLGRRLLHGGPFADRRRRHDGAIAQASPHEKMRCRGAVSSLV